MIDEKSTLEAIQAEHNTERRKLNTMLHELKGRPPSAGIKAATVEVTRLFLLFKAKMPSQDTLIRRRELKSEE